VQWSVPTIWKSTVGRIGEKDFGQQWLTVRGL
jgi:hypothetical protein